MRAVWPTLLAAMFFAAILSSSLQAEVILSSGMQPSTATEPADKDFDVQSSKAGVVRVVRQVGEPPRVRIGLKLTPYRELAVRNKRGQREVHRVAGESVKAVLRARTDRINHFYVGNWHVETVPLKYVKQTGKYSVRLDVSERFGAQSEVEEPVGTMVVSGTLRQEDARANIHVLQGAASVVWNRKDGSPRLAAIAGLGTATNGAPAVAPAAPLLSRDNAVPTNAYEGNGKTRF